MSDPSYSLSALLRSRVLPEFKKELNVALPAVVEEYDAETKRAVVLPAVRLMLADRMRSRALLLDVPVVHPSAGGYLVHLPIQPGDPVLLVFSQRGLTEFKASFAESDPDVDSVLEAKDAVAFPGFGALQVTPKSTDGLSIQNEAGTVSIVLSSDDNVTIEIPSDSNVHLGGPGGQELVTRAHLAAAFDTHIHTTPMGPSGPPTITSPKTPGSDITKKTKSE